jgi:hypothetical protein
MPWDDTRSPARSRAARAPVEPSLLGCDPARSHDGSIAASPTARTAQQAALYTRHGSDALGRHAQPRAQSRLHPEYAAGVEGAWLREAYASVDQPMTILGFTDDEFMTTRSTDSLHRLYINARMHPMWVDPASFDLRRIGHFGFFRREHGAVLWPALLMPALSIADQPVATVS